MSGSLMEAGASHRLPDPEALKMLEACNQSNYHQLSVAGIHPRRTNVEHPK